VASTELALQEQSIEGLYADHHGWLKAWLRRRLGNSFDAADLAHDTFFRLLARQEPLALQEPRAFLTTVASRVLANHWRREQLERAYLETLQRFPEELAPSPEARAILLETLYEIDALLDGLPVAARRAFLLSQLDGLTQAQIADQLNVSARTVRRYLTQAAERFFFSDVFRAGA